MKLPSIEKLKETMAPKSVKKIVTGVLAAIVITMSTPVIASNINNSSAVLIKSNNIEIERVITLTPDNTGILSAYHSSHRSHSSHYSCTPGVTC